eukprot:12915256-Alexandrium_andersonii.AAC.1
MRSTARVLHSGARRAQPRPLLRPRRRLAPRRVRARGPVRPRAPSPKHRRSQGEPRRPIPKAWNGKTSCDAWMTRMMSG